MILTFGASKDGTFTGAAYEGIELLPALTNKINFIPEPLFGLNDPHQIAFPITALGAVGAALSLIPNFAAQGLDRRQRHRCLHRHRYVLVGLPQYPYSHARRHWLS